MGHTETENTHPSHKTDTMEANLAATFDAGSSFNTKLRDTLQGLLAANNERKSEIDARRRDSRRITRTASQTSPSLTASWTARTAPGRRRSRLWTAGPSQRTTPARRRSLTSRTLPRLRMTL